MKISYSDYIRKSEPCVLVAQAIFTKLLLEYPVKKIEEVAETTSGGTPLRSNSDYYGGNIPWLKSGELTDGFIEFAEEFITEKGLANSSAKLHEEGTLLIAMYGATVGKVGITKIKASTNQAVCAVFPNENIERDFLYWFFRAYRYNFIEISKGGAQPNISQSVIQKTHLPVPPITTQKNIVEILQKIASSTTVDINIIPDDFKKIVINVNTTKNNVTLLEAQLTHQQDLLKQLRQAFLREAMQGKLVAQDAADGNAADLLHQIKTEKEKLVAEKKLKKEKPLPPIKPEEIPFDIPENWVWCRLGELGICQTGTTPSTLVKEYFGSDIAFIKPADITLRGLILNNEGLTLLGLKQGILIPKNSVLMVCIGGSIGKSFYNNVDVSCNQQINSITPLAKIKASFLQYWLQSNYFQKAIWAKASGGTTPIVNRSKWESIFLPLPPLAEQHRIVQKLDELMQLCDSLQASIQASQQQNNMLLQVALKEALSGGANAR